MTKIEVNAIATRALIDKDFEAAILNGHRRELLQEFQLPEKVFNAIMCIQGEDLQAIYLSTERFSCFSYHDAIKMIWQ